jgi:hypothetical protein
VVAATVIAKSAVILFMACPLVSMAAVCTTRASRARRAVSDPEVVSRAVAAAHQPERPLDVVHRR